MRGERWDIRNKKGNINHNMGHMIKYDKMMQIAIGFLICCSSKMRLKKWKNQLQFASENDKMNIGNGNNNVILNEYELKTQLRISYDNGKKWGKWCEVTSQKTVIFKKWMVNLLLMILLLLLLIILINKIEDWHRPAAWPPAAWPPAPIALLLKFFVWKW